MNDDDAALVRRAVAGEAAAFRDLVDRHYDACLRYATHMLRDSGDAEDAVQETFVRAYRRLGAYREEGRFRSWLFRILVNRCKTSAKRNGRHDRLFVDRDVLEIEAPISRSEPVDSSLLRDAHRALAQLPPPQREAFLLKVVEEWTYEEIAAMTSTGISALKMRVARARDALRNALEEQTHG